MWVCTQCLSAIKVRMRPMVRAASCYRSSPTVQCVVLTPQELLLAATSHGLASCPMEGFDMRRLRKELRIPLRYSVPIVVSIGYPSEAERNFKTLRCESLTSELHRTIAVAPPSS